MNRASDDDRPAGFASPPCFMHEFEEVDSQQRTDVMRWRKAERRRLIEARLALDSKLRRRHTARIADRVEELIGDARGLTVSAYWPLRGEPDLRALLARLAAAGARTALPVVAAPKAPLVFRAWRPGEPLKPGVWNIPEPSEGAEVTPDVVIAPVVGFDAACYRLGHGGGYFDRTLAAMAARPRVLGVGYALARIATIFPQPHDIPMDLVATEDAVHPPETADRGPCIRAPARD
jgi:5,10-methenyltetrahydrofolate synthetase